METTILDQDNPCSFKLLNTIIENTTESRLIILNNQPKFLNIVITLHSLNRIVANNPINAKIKTIHHLVKRSFSKWVRYYLMDELNQWLQEQPQEITIQFQEIKMISILDLLLMLIAPNIYVNDTFIKTQLNIIGNQTIRTYKFNLLQDKIITKLFDQLIWNNQRIKPKLNNHIIEIIQNYKDNSNIIYAEQSYCATSTNNIIKTLL